VTEHSDFNPYESVEKTSSMDNHKSTDTINNVNTFGSQRSGNTGK
jgi:hypothetical protein